MLLYRLNASGSHELYDYKLFLGKASRYIVVAQISWFIFEGSKQIRKVQKSKAEFENSKLEYQQYVSQSRLELNNSKRN